MNRKNLNILIVDKEDGGLGRILEDKGYTVCVRKPEEVQEFVKNNLVHIALIDVTDGNQVFGTVREANGLTQMIAVSARATVENVIAAMENGANDFIFKPYMNMDNIVSIVEESEKKLVRWQTVLKNLGAL